MVYSNTIVYGGNEYGVSVTCIYFYFLKHISFRASFLHPITDTDSMQDNAVQICF